MATTRKPQTPAPPSSTNALGGESPVDKGTVAATAAVKEALDILIRRASFGGGVGPERAALASAIALLAGCTPGERAYIVRTLRQ